MKIFNRILLNWICMLCFFGGFVNTVSFAKFSYTISHFTGYLLKTTFYIETGKLTDVFKILLIMLSFLIGATVSGFLIDGREFNFKKRYGISILILGVVLLLFYFLFYDSPLFFYYLPFMMGVQNGLFISYKGVIVRSSHITGSVTDAGVYIGHYLKGKKEDKWKIWFCLFIILTFFVGGTLGFLTFATFKDRSFIFIGVGYIIVAIVYFYLRRRYINVLHLEDEHYHF